MDVQLTQGAIGELMSNRPVEKPVLQIIGLKKIAPNVERYRLSLSDGIHTSASFTLATQLNDRLTNGELEIFSVIRIDKLVCNRIPPTGPATKVVVIILDFTVISNDPELGKIGNPTGLEQNVSNTGTSAESASSSSKPRESAASSSFLRDPPAASSFARETASFRDSSRNSNQFINRNPSFASNMSNQRQPTSQFAGKTFPISSLTPYQNRWAICARVINKTSIRTWSNARGDGKLFSVTLLDSSGEIKATAFNAECDKFFDVLLEGKVFYVSNAQVKNANKQYTVNHDYEINFHKDTIVEMCNDVNEMPQVQFNFVPIQSLSNAGKDAFVDVLGICKSCGNVQTFTSKANREFRKRELQLVDKSNTEINLTLWGDDAEKFDGSLNPVIAIKGARVSDFGGCSLSLVQSSIMQVNPDCSETFSLRSWFDNEAAHSDIQSLSSKSGAGFSGPAEWKCLAQVEEDNMGGGDKADFFTCKAVVVMIKKENCLYKACTVPGCSKKVVDNNGFYRCEKCDRENTDFKWRLLLNMNLADYSGNLWVTCFQDQAEAVLGKTAEELGSLMQSGDEERVHAAIMEATFNSFVFKLRTKVENYNDENRIKTNVVTVSEVNHAEYGKKLIEDLQN